ncbi:hypothetical protein VCHA53O466_40402 [Vibrio chagasii]|nr:hypothetical protein VCHA53O466_40402 [Vibrio chagasii]
MLFVCLNGFNYIFVFHLNINYCLCSMTLPSLVNRYTSLLLLTSTTIKAQDMSINVKESAFRMQFIRKILSVTFFEMPIPSTERTFLFLFISNILIKK